MTEKINKLKTKTTDDHSFDHSRTFEFDKIPRTSLLLKPVQMTREGYPKPDQNDFSATHAEYDPVSDKSPLFALNCEIIYDDNGEIEVAWVALTNEHLEVFQEIFVKPDESYLNVIKK